MLTATLEIVRTSVANRAREISDAWTSDERFHRRRLADQKIRGLVRLLAAASLRQEQSSRSSSIGNPRRVAG